MDSNITRSGKIVIGSNSLDVKVLSQSLKQEITQLEKRVNALQQQQTPNLNSLNHFSQLLQLRRTILHWVQEQSSI